MEERKSSNGSLTILVIILLIAVLGLTGFIVYDKVLKKDKVEPNITDNSSTEEIKDLSIYDDLVLNLKYPSHYIWFEESEKNWTYENTKVSDMKRDFMMKIASDNVKCIEDDYKSYAKCSADDIEINFKKIFGPDVSYYNGSLESSECGVINTYNKSDNTYSEPIGCGGDSLSKIKRFTKEFKAEQQGDYIYVYEYVQSILLNENPDTAKIQVYLLDKNGNEIEEIDYDNYESIARKRINDGKADTYKWTFKKQSDGNYYFYSGNWE